MKAVLACNQYVDEQAPWALEETDPERMKAVLADAVHRIRDLAIAIQPVVPTRPSACSTAGILAAKRNYVDLDR